MRRVPVQSRAIASVGYDRTTNVLELELAEGEVYQYYAVPVSVHQQLLAADSIGRYFLTEIRGRYGYRRL